MGRFEKDGAQLTLVVIDASACLSWVLTSQRTDAAMSFLGAADDKDFTAPFVFQWETQNVLLRLLRKRSLTDPEYELAISNLSDYDVAIGEPFPAGLLEPLARSEQLSLFDAAYLALALEQDAEIASRDTDLLSAAARHGLITWDLQ